METEHKFLKLKIRGFQIITSFGRILSSSQNSSFAKRITGPKMGNSISVPRKHFLGRSIYLGENATRFHVLFWRSGVDVTRLGFIGPFIVWIRRKGVVDDEALSLVSLENQFPV